MIKVLNAFQVLNNAGTEKVMYNLYSQMNKSIVHCDYLVCERGTNEQTFRDLGANIFNIPFNNEKEYLEKLIDFFQENKYDILHVHSHAFKNMLTVLKAAKICNIKVRILHVHGARLDLPFVFKIYKRLQELVLTKYTTHLFACSTAAAKWNFPINYKKAKIICNGINLEKFLYDEKTRETVRKTLGIEWETKVILNVGRLSKSKNQKKILKIAKECKKEKLNYKFLLAGDGELRNVLQSIIDINQLQEHVMMLGSVNNVNEYLMAADIFLFPTQYEGLGVALIEAQTSGIEVISSDRVPKEVDISNGTLDLIPLNANIKKWKEKIVSKDMISSDLRRQRSNLAINSNYNIKEASQDLEKKYISMLKEEDKNE